MRAASPRSPSKPLSATNRKWLAELLGDSDEEAAALSPLRRADAHSRAAAQLILLVKQVEHVSADGHPLQDAGPIEILRDACVEDPVTRQFTAVRNDARRIIGSEAGTVNEVGRGNERAEAVLDRVAGPARSSPFLRMVG